MKKERYEVTELEIIRFSVEDILNTSGEEDDIGFASGDIKLI